MEGKKIYIADDDDDDIMIFKAVLKEVCALCTVESFYNGLDLTENLKNSKKLPDLIFLDINMPIVCGLTALESIRRNYPEKRIPIMMYSTSANDDYILKAHNLGADFYCIKPYDLEKIKACISHFINMDFKPERPKTQLSEFVLKW
jgi:CheY-like chemotaxis protein